MKLTQATQGFALALIADRYSNRTVEAYRMHLVQLADYLHDPDVASITEDDLRQYFTYLKTDYKPHRFNGDNKPLAYASISKMWIAIRSFFRWATVDLRLATNPSLPIKQPKYTTKTILPFTQAEINRLLKAATSRNKAIIMILLDTGLRVGEMCRLLIKDVNLETGEIFVTPFGSGQKTKSRVVYLGKAARRVVWRYTAEVGNDRDPAAPLILSNHRQPMTRNAVRCMLNCLGKSANVPNCHPHKFRHTFAIQYLRNGGDVFTLQRLLGHSSLEMVRHYLALAKSDDAHAHQSASPVDRWGF